MASGDRMRNGAAAGGGGVQCRYYFLSDVSDTIVGPAAPHHPGNSKLQDSFVARQIACRICMCGIVTCTWVLAWVQSDGRSVPLVPHAVLGQLAGPQSRALCDGAGSTAQVTVNASDRTHSALPTKGHIPVTLVALDTCARHCS